MSRFLGLTSGLILKLEGGELAILEATGGPPEKNGRSKWTPRFVTG